MAIVLTNSLSLPPADPRDHHLRFPENSMSWYHPLCNLHQVVDYEMLNHLYGWSSNNRHNDCLSLLLQKNGTMICHDHRIQAPFGLHFSMDFQTRKVNKNGKYILPPYKEYLVTNSIRLQNSTFWRSNIRNLKRWSLNIRKMNAWYSNRFVKFKSNSSPNANPFLFCFFHTWGV